MQRKQEVLQDVVIKFAGDSCDGMQLTGTQFTNNTALLGADLSTFPDFPAEIRAPQGTLPGVSGYQLRFSSESIHTPGDQWDVLVAMNAAALKKNVKSLKKGGKIIVNTDGFDAKNLRLANYPDGVNPIEDNTLEGYEVIKMDVTKMTREALKDYQMGTKEKDRAKNMFVLGFLYWMYGREMKNTEKFLEEKFGKKPDIRDSNLKALRAGYNFGDTTETFTTQYKVEKAHIKPGSYRSIMGNQALAYGLIAASVKSGLEIFLGTYPITPASDILHELSRHKNFGVKTFQAEDEIAGITAAIGASYGGKLGVTTTSGPGMALKSEAMGLAMMLEIPLLICDIQRGGPSTGLPTKTEQSDLLQAYYGRNGESPIPVISASMPSDCFDVAYEAVRIAIQHMTPVILLSDGYIANGAEPWLFPSSADLHPIEVKFKKGLDEGEEKLLPYKRDEKLVRPWAIPGTAGLEHRIGGIEKDDITGNVSYDAANHEHMVKTRAQKIANIANEIPELTVTGPEEGDLLVIGWGGTYGALLTAVQRAQRKGLRVAHAHLRYLNPMPRNTAAVLRRYRKVLVPELNSGQLLWLLRAKFLVDAVGLNKVQGRPFLVSEIEAKIAEVLGEYAPVAPPKNKNGLHVATG